MICLWSCIFVAIEWAFRSSRWPMLGSCKSFFWLLSFLWLGPVLVLRLLRFFLLFLRICRRQKEEREWREEGQCLCFFVACRRCIVFLFVFLYYYNWFPFRFSFRIWRVTVRAFLLLLTGSLLLPVLGVSFINWHFVLLFLFFVSFCLW